MSVQIYKKNDTKMLLIEKILHLIGYMAHVLNFKSTENIAEAL